MKFGDRVTTSLGPGIYVGGANGFLKVFLEASGKVERWRPSQVSIPSQVDAVVGEQCQAILERLRDALGVGSLGEVEAAVMGMLGKAET